MKVTLDKRNLYLNEKERAEIRTQINGIRPGPWRIGKYTDLVDAYGKILVKEVGNGVIGRFLADSRLHVEYLLGDNDTLHAHVAALHQEQDRHVDALKEIQTLAQRIEMTGESVIDEEIKRVLTQAAMIAENALDRKEVVHESKQDTDDVC